MKRINNTGQVVMTGATHLTLLICIVLAGMALYVPLRDYRDLRREVKQSRLQLAELEVLFPLYAELMQLDRPDAWPILALPEAGDIRWRGESIRRAREAFHGAQEGQKGAVPRGDAVVAHEDAPEARPGQFLQRRRRPLARAVHAPSPGEVHACGGILFRDDADAGG